MTRGTKSWIKIKKAAGDFLPQLKFYTGYLFALAIGPVEERYDLSAQAIRRRIECCG